ncbi:hypothetical protein [Acinetobacter sp. YH12120]|uniref:hypothetical protein n=1 Tax=Acinetobacter sp. YH12120 TaxID=2601107 RepID=UPI0015D3531F|nr:hypothetical protein [Acinetobacter sp. YH12120]
MKIGYVSLTALLMVGCQVVPSQQQFSTALLHKDLKCKAPLIEPNLRRNLGNWST